MLVSFPSFHPYLDFSSYFLSCFSWQHLQKEFGGSSRSCLWRLLQCVYLSKRIDQTPWKAISHVRSWASLTLLFWSDHPEWSKRKPSELIIEPRVIFRCLFIPFSDAGYSGILYSGWTQFTFLLELGKKGFRIHFEGKLEIYVVTLKFYMVFFVSFFLFFSILLPCLPHPPLCFFLFLPSHLPSFLKSW